MICYLYAQSVDIFMTKQRDTFFWHQYVGDEFRIHEERFVVLVYEE